MAGLFSMMRKQTLCLRENPFDLRICFGIAEKKE